jgi:hypothetical protein
MKKDHVKLPQPTDEQAKSSAAAAAAPAAPAEPKEAAAAEPKASDPAESKAAAPSAVKKKPARVFPAAPAASGEMVTVTTDTEAIATFVTGFVRG